MLNLLVRVPLHFLLLVKLKYQLLYTLLLLLIRGLAWCEWRDTKDSNAVDFIIVTSQTLFRKRGGG